jgi:excisionase family DNA binding protein
MRPPQDRLLRVDQVALRLNCSKSWVYSLVSDGRLQHIRLGRRKGFRVSENSLEIYIRAAIAEFDSSEE